MDSIGRYAGSDDSDFAKWLRKVDEISSRQIGLSIFDLEDYDWWSIFENGLSPHDGFDIFLEDTGCYDFLEDSDYYE